MLPLLQEMTHSGKIKAAQTPFKSGNFMAASLIGLGASRHEHQHERGARSARTCLHAAHRVRRELTAARAEPNWYRFQF
jgi:hypothetical protein